MSTLLIDNYDSYAIILAHLIARVEGGRLPTVVKNDEVSFEQLKRHLQGGAEGFARVVIGPGPGTPLRSDDLGFVAEFLASTNGAHDVVPVFGVCLGHQALAASRGGVVARNPLGPMHGRVQGITHDGKSRLFDGVPSGRANGFVATRYHSLATTDVGRGQRPTAWAEEDGTIMALESVDLPRFGVQFHPESVCTTHGERMYANFLRVSEEWWSSRGDAPVAPEAFASRAPRCLGKADEAKGSTRVRLAFEKVGASTVRGLTTEDIFWSCFGLDDADCFWLDTADETKGRFSFMGGRGGALWRRVQYRLGAPASSERENVSGKVSWRAGGASAATRADGTLVVADADGRVVATRLENGFVEWMNDELESRRLSGADASALPFEFHGGFVGYLGYEMRDECDSLPRKYQSPLPDAAFFLADRLVAFDHATRETYVVGVYEDDDDSVEGESADATKEWISRTARKIEGLSASPIAAGVVDAEIGAMSSSQLLNETGFSWRRNHDEYIGDIEASQEAIRDGETYEVCLTNMLHRKNGQRLRVRELYTELRRSNPAPYASLLSFASSETGGDPLVICCCSPERFLRHKSDGALEAKPIKGTCKRVEPLGCEADLAAAKALEENIKDRAENLMIVDLLRNDLARVCDVGSVEVPGLMKIESYATVHQLVSTVRGRRSERFTQMDVVRSAYPGGSMTGAPKIRTMEIIDALEIGPRMVYSGSIGFFSFSSAFDLNIVIRSVILNADDAWIGAGGAITILSDPQGEWEEIELKASALLRAVARVEKHTTGMGSE